VITKIEITGLYDKAIAFAFLKNNHIVIDRLGNHNLICCVSSLIKDLENGKPFHYRSDSDFHWQWERDISKLNDILTRKNVETIHDGLIWSEYYELSDLEVDSINDKIVSIKQQEKAAEWLSEQSEEVRGYVNTLTRMSMPVG
jgi:hypothetical protein